MSLAKYNEKRRFDETPEPQGKPTKNKGVLRFVIQKHQASHLHYDFRLEMEGVLKSWAIPKGPSSDPNIKRLAMMVEDHPYDYRDFEGTIPKRNYGAGTVMVWDQGNYMPLETKGDIGKTLLDELEKGNLKIILNGNKIKGEYHLFKINTSENSWMLMKGKDEFANEDELIKQDLSVKTGRSMDEIKNGEKPKESLNLDGATKKKMPDFIKPMLSTLIKNPFDNRNWIFEIKWDGYRIISVINNGKANLLSRNNISFNEKFKPIQESLKEIKENMILDGEVVVLDKNGKSSFQLLQNFVRSEKGNLVYYIFDILYFKDSDLTNLPLYKRKDILKNVLPNLPNIKISDFISERGVSFFNAAAKQKLEGIIGKNLESRYLEGKRTEDWVKIKSRLQQEAVIGGFTKPRGSRKYFGSLILGVYDDEKNFIYIGNSGGGFNDTELKEIGEKLENLSQKESPFLSPPKTDMPVTWIKPLIVCEVEFTEWTNEGVMRQPKFLGFREDLDPKNVRKEKAVNAKTVKDEKINFKLSNLEKTYWPTDGYTKRDLVKFYYKISPYILPYLKDRPENLHRFPNGINGEKFWQKDTRGLFPKWIETKDIYSGSEEKNINYIICQNKETLVYMANLGCIEINPWFSRIISLDKPDYLVIDLDPLDISFDYVVETAIRSKEILDAVGLNSYCKTSGATGLHIFVPLKSRYSFKQSRQFAEILCKIIHRKIPSFTSVERNPQNRKKKVYLDFLQNRDGQTIAAPYSLKPVEKASVSTPLRWEEVKIGLNPKDFNIENIFERLEKIGDIWSPVLDEESDLAIALEKLQINERIKLRNN